MNEMKVRAFIAIELPPSHLQIIDGLQARLKDQGLNLRWVQSRNVHLTLKFLGDVPSADLVAVEAAMRQASEATHAFVLVMQGLGVFPGIRRPNVLWCGIGGQTDVLQGLHGRLEDALAGQGFARDQKAFKAHLTLGRIKDRIDTEKLARSMHDIGQFAPCEFQAAQMVLFKSDLRPQGAVYTPLARTGFK